MSEVITREQMENQIEIMVAQRNQFEANMNAANGAIQVLQYLLSTIADGDIQASTEEEKEEKED